MERSVGSRLIGLFQQLDKIGGKAAKNPSTADDLQQIRYVTSKIYQILNTQEKIHRDSVLKSSSQLDLLLSTLKNCTDRAVVVNIIHILLELIGKTQVGKRSSALVGANTTNIVLQCLVKETEDSVASNDEVLILSHQVLAKLSTKDRKFATKARLHRTLLITLTLIKSNICHFKNLQCLLQVFKSYTNNSVNASYLGKHNSIPPMFRVIQQCARKHTTVLKLALEILYNLTKSRNNAARTIGGDHVPQLLSLYQEWHQMDTKHRHVLIRKAILNILKNVTNLRSGRKALADANGIQILYDTAQDVIDCREMESLILLASVIMRKCCPRNKLPCDIRSPIVYELPESELYPESSRQDGSQVDGSASETPDSDNSSLDDDDDIDSDDERFKTDNCEETEDDHGEAPQSSKRSPEDLRMYDTFFPEIFEIEVKEEDDLDQPGTPASIYIPTGAYDPFVSAEAQQVKQSFYQREATFSFSTRTNNFTYESEYSDTSYRPFRCDSATAINLKTGSSLFSLDIPQMGNKSALKKSLLTQSKSTKKTKGGKKSVKDKKGKKNSIASCPDLIEFENEFESMQISQDQKEVDETGSSSEEEDTDVFSHDALVYQDKAADTKGVFRFEKLAYPDLVGARGCPYLEPLYRRKFGVQRAKVFEDIDRMIHPENIIDREVYDVDAIIKRCGSSYCHGNSNLSNRDELRIGSQLDAVGANSLRFNAQFECGNLRKAIWVREFEYDLILNPDVNTNHHHQWFYFEVSNMTADIPYRFNIVNCEKLNSQFNFGMKPVMFSVTESIEGRPFWFRVGTDICYYKNHFTRSAQATGGVKGKTYYTATFTVKFKHNKDICYMAYHFPYSYTTLQTHIHVWDRSVDHSQIFFRNQTLCQTINGNNVPVLTITAQPKSYSRDHVEELRSRPYIFLSGRVHPGESNASWVMKGTIDFLVSKKPAAQQLRENFIIKIVPMLNPDGVINGNHRCSLAAEDLNRRWDNPCPKLHPTIYHTKGLLQYLQMINKSPLVYCDYHGHSRRKNIFLYGCSPTMSWIQNDTENPACTGNRLEDNAYKTLPRILHMTSPVFSWQNCSFIVEKAKETTARVVVWRQIGVLRSYTMESTYCGIDRDGKFKDQHVTTSMLEDMGQKFSEALIRTRTKFTADNNTVSFPPLSDSQQNLGATAQDPDLLADIDDDLEETIHRRPMIRRRDDDENVYSGNEDIDDLNGESSEEEIYGEDDEENYGEERA